MGSGGDRAASHPALGPDTLAALRAITGAAGCVTEREAIARYLIDGRGQSGGRTPVVMRPASTEETARIVRLCVERGIAMVPQGGHTGYMGGAQPDESGTQVIISLGRMSRIRALDADDFTMTVEAGCVLARVHEAAAAADRLFPLSMGSEGSCHIGGNLATNAGGTAVLRYGTARDLVLGLEAVLPSGEIWHGLRTLRKDNTGYSLRSLLVGAEGTLGIITAAVLKLFPRPHVRATAFAALPDAQCAVALLGLLRERTGDLLSAFEYVDGSALALVARHDPKLRLPFADSPKAVLIELSGGIRDQDFGGVLETVLGVALQRRLLTDAVVARSIAEQQDFWGIRERIPEAQASAGSTLLYDVAVPTSRVPELLREGAARVRTRYPDVLVSPFGHLGDGNVHFDLVLPAHFDPAAVRTARRELDDVLYDLVASLGGSFSAEHGIGRSKRGEMRRYRSPTELAAMRALKHALDPQNLMNPGKLLPEA